MKTKRLLPIVVVIAIPVALYACGSETMDPPPPPPPPTEETAKISRIEVFAPVDTIVALSTRHQFSVIAFDSTGTITPTPPVTWTSTVPSVISITQTGIATATANGATKIVARSEAFLDTANVVVRQKPTSIAINASADELKAIGIRALFTAEAFDSAGQTVAFAQQVEWESSDTGVATIDSAGVLVSVSNGTTTVTATTAGVSATAIMRVDQSIPVEDVAGTVAFVGANLISMTSGQVIADQTVITRNGLIESIGPAGSLTVPTEAHMVDAGGKYLMPGLTDMHTHFATETAIAAGEGQLLQFLANGITTILNQGDFGFDGFSAGTPFPDWARQARDQLIPSPTIYLARYARGPQDGGPPNVEVSGVDQARLYVQESDQLGYDFIKVYNFTGAAEFATMQQEAQRLGLGFIGHFPVAIMEGIDALNGGLQMVGHAGFGGFWTRVYKQQFDPTVTQTAIAMLQANNAWVNPTIGVERIVASVWGGNTAGFDALFRQEGIRYVHPATKNRWDIKVNQQRLFNPQGAVVGGRDSIVSFIEGYVRSFYDAGVRMVIGSDSPTVLLVAGFSINKELAAFRQMGLSPFEVLEIATSNAGKFIDETRPGSPRFGTIEVGNRADILLLNSNPLADLANLKDRYGVMARGRWRSETQLLRLLDALAESVGN